MIAFHKRKFTTTLWYEGGGRKFRRENTRNDAFFTWKKLRKQKLAKRSSHEETFPPPPIKKKTFFSGGGLRAYSAPQAGDPVFNTINTHSGEYAAIPLNIVPSNTISITFVYKITFLQIFLTKLQQNILQNAPFFFNFLGGACPRTP